MKAFPVAILLLLFSCTEFRDRTKIETDIITPEILTDSKVKISFPEGALKADFFGNQDSLHVFIKSVDTTNETILIGFENELLPEITFPESLGAHLNILKLKNFENDVLLVNVIPKDTNFNEYYVFVWKDSAWNQPVNHFFIHKSNMSDTLVPIKNNPKDTMQLMRYYSVFEMDPTSDKKYSWRLMQESISID